MGCCDYVYETRDKVTHWDPLKDIRDVGGDLSDAVKHRGNTLFNIKKDFEDNTWLGQETKDLLDKTGIGEVLEYEGELFYEYHRVISGDYANRQKDLNEKITAYNDAVAEYEKVMDAFNDEYVIDDEIFQLAHKNKGKDLQDEYMPNIKVLYAKVLAAQKEFNKDFHIINEALRNSKFFSMLLWVPMVIGGLISDAEDFLTKGDWEAGRRLLSITLEVIGILITIVLLIASLVADAATGGATSFLTVMLITSLIAQITLLVIQLDSAYAKGTLMNGVFSVLDFLLNDILHLDDVWEELGTDKLSDPKYYQELTGYIQTIAAITALVTSIASLNCEGYAEVAKSASATLPAGISEYTVITSSMSYKVLSTAYNAYKLYDDSRRAEEALEALKEKSKNDIDKINKKLESNKSRKMMESYRAEEQILTGTSNIVSEYAMSAFASPTSSFDPEMTIAANYGYEYSGDNVMDFIPEFTTDYDSLAGGSKYVNKILYKI